MEEIGHAEPANQYDNAKDEVEELYHDTCIRRDGISCNTRNEIPVVYLIDRRIGREYLFPAYGCLHKTRSICTDIFFKLPCRLWIFSVKHAEIIIRLAAVLILCGADEYISLVVYDIHEPLRGKKRYGT